MLTAQGGLPFHGANRTASENFIVEIEHNRLSWRSHLKLMCLTVEKDFGGSTPVRIWRDSARNRRTTISNNSIRFERRRRPNSDGEGDTISSDSSGNSPFPISDDQLISFRVQLQHEQWLRPRDSDPTALTDCVVHKAIMTAEYVSVLVDNLAGPSDVRSPLCHKVGIRPFPTKQIS